jgi:hypothetical protein
MSGLADLGTLRGSERQGQSRVEADLDSVLVSFVLARAANCGIDDRRNDRAEGERG